MDIKALVTVGEFDFPEPSTYSGGTSTLVDSARNVQGVMVGSVIRDDVGKVEMTWKYLTIEQWANILKCFSVKKGGKFINDVTFFSQDSGAWETRSMYVGDRKAEAWRRNPETGEMMGWVNCSLNLIEV
jgi:hypothetical protein